MIRRYEFYLFVQGPCNAGVKPPRAMVPTTSSKFTHAYGQIGRIFASRFLRLQSRFTQTAVCTYNSKQSVLLLGAAIMKYFWLSFEFLYTETLKCSAGCRVPYFMYSVQVCMHVCVYQTMTDRAHNTPVVYKQGWLYIVADAQIYIYIYIGRYYIMYIISIG